MPGWKTIPYAWFSMLLLICSQSFSVIHESNDKSWFTFNVKAYCRLSTRVIKVESSSEVSAGISPIKNSRIDRHFCFPFRQTVCFSRFRDEKCRWWSVLAVAAAWFNIPFHFERNVNQSAVPTRTSVEGNYLRSRKGCPWTSLRTRCLMSLWPVIWVQRFLSEGMGSQRFVWIAEGWAKGAKSRCLVDAH